MLSERQWFGGPRAHGTVTGGRGSCGRPKSKTLARTETTMAMQGRAESAQLSGLLVENYDSTCKHALAADTSPS